MQLNFSTVKKGAAWSLAVAVCFFAISSHSLWIDEANSAMKAMAPDLRRFLALMCSERGSDLQMPLYMLMLWGWEKLFGHSEFALRALNIPFFAAAIGTATASLKLPLPTRLFFALFACCSAFVWAYLDEARPYTLQFCAATLVMVALVNTIVSQARASKTSIVLFGFGTVLLFGSSLIGAVFAAFYLLAFVLAELRAEPVRQLLAGNDARLAAIWYGPPLASLSIYYFWTLSLGAGASSVGATGISSTAFTLYEMFGFVGIGPGRSELRESAASTLPAFFPELATYTIVLSVFIVFGAISAVTSCRDRKIEVFIVVVCVAGACVSVFAAGIAGNFRVLGRHLMPVMPFVLLCFAIFAQALWSRGTMPARSIVVFTLAVMISSALAQRTAVRHAKDDYRGAANAAAKALQERQVVWWAADRSAANYYGVFPQLPAEISANALNMPEPVFMANNRDAAYLARLPEPGLVILSKPDVYDAKGELRKFLGSRGYELSAQLAAFSIFSLRRP